MQTSLLMKIAKNCTKRLNAPTAIRNPAATNGTQFEGLQR
jgi:hypothetical protein